MESAFDQLCSLCDRLPFGHISPEDITTSAIPISHPANRISHLTGCTALKRLMARESKPKQEAEATWRVTVEKTLVFLCCSRSNVANERLVSELYPKHQLPWVRKMVQQIKALGETA